MLVTKDKTSKQQTREAQTAQPVMPSQPTVHGFEYERNGVANLFMLIVPLPGWRSVSVTDQQTMINWAILIWDLVDIHCPGQQIFLVIDKQNTHLIAFPYEGFEPAEARRIAERLEIYDTRHTGTG